jgi:hypothetical protein
MVKDKMRIETIQKLLINVSMCLLMQNVNQEIQHLSALRSTGSIHKSLLEDSNVNAQNLM